MATIITTAARTSNPTEGDINYVTDLIGETFYFSAL
jgi:hypothetical protein